VIADFRDLLAALVAPEVRFLDLEDLRVLGA
jgi:hypothetical protein